MSSNNFTKIGHIRPDEFITLLGVNRKQTEDLSDYLRRKIRETEGLNLRKIEERSNWRITHSYLSKIMSRQVKNPSLEKLKAIAKGLGVTEDEVIAVARGKSPIDDPNFYKTRFGNLSLKFDKVPIDRRVKAEVLIDILERELDLLTRDN